MRIENTPQVRPGYQKHAGQAAPAATFDQVMQARAQDQYVPSVRTQPIQTEVEFSRAERTYGDVTVSNATHAKLKQLAELDKQSDYTGMSTDEVFAEIWNRYNEAFDGNMVVYTACIAGPEEWDVINNQFVDEITAHVINPVAAAVRKAAWEADRETGTERSHAEEHDLYEFSMRKGSEASRDARWKVLGYYDMSFEEREAAIKEKYAGKNTTMDFLRMQSELDRSGVLTHTMGDGASTYTDLIGYQFEVAYNPNSIYTVGPDNCDFMTADQWYRVADQPFDIAKFAANTKDLLNRISFNSKYPADFANTIAKAVDRFMDNTVGDGIDLLLDGTERS